MPQARDSRIPASGQGVPSVGGRRAYASTTKPQASGKPASTRSRSKRRIILLVGIAASLFAILLIWTGVSAVHARPASIASFSVTSGSANLYANFQLANSEGELVSAAGSGTLEFSDGSGNILARHQISFTKKDFDGTSRICCVAVPKTTLDLRNSVNRGETFAAAFAQARTALARGRATITIATDNDGHTLTAVCEDIQFYSDEEAARISRKIYFDEAIQVFEAEINRQWPFAVQIADYAMIGGHGWAVAGRSGNEIIFYPYAEIHDWYLLQTKDGGRNWGIAWRGDTAPLFRVEITDENTLKVTTPSGAFHANFKGEGAVEFVDPNLEAAIREAVGIPENPIYPSDLAGLTHLSAANRDISDLTGLERCTNLESLELQQNQIRDISPLGSLTNLTSLILHGNEIGDVSPLASLTELTTLHLSENQIRDIRPLASLTALEYLYLSVNRIRDISPLAGLTNLAILMLQENQIRDISSLVNNRGLGDGDAVGLTDNPLSEVSVGTYLPVLRGRDVRVIWPVTAPSVTTGSSQDAHPSPGPGPDPP